MKMTKDKLEAIAEAPEGIKNSWSETQLFIAGIVGEVRKELND